ncbi:rCG32922, isoform CRA_c [Rattus norvegicus]|uniref:RCG32922, isoform CRA_c n=1 Tax=Rattus norvegicus TaxID=10116 RepID=A6HHG3_RAT|nr:rCG32922, isoform CRA_c [Rattus norvegicus]
MKDGPEPEQRGRASHLVEGGSFKTSLPVSTSEAEPGSLPVLRTSCCCGVSLQGQHIPYNPWAV